MTSTGVSPSLDGGGDPTKRLYVVRRSSASSRRHRVGRAAGRPADRWREVMERPQTLVLLLHGQGQHHLPQPDLAEPSCWPTRRQGAKGGTAGARRLSATRSSSAQVLMEASSSPRPAGRDLRARPPQPLPARRVPLLRGAAGPESQDADFTWSEFVRRTNDELVAGWGNLVNRTANLIAKNFGEIPKAGELTATTRRCSTGSGRPSTRWAT